MAHFGPSAEVKKALLIRERFLIPKDAYVFGFVGRLVAEKGIMELAEAWKSVKNDHPDSHLLIISPPEVGDSIQSVVEGLRQDHSVHFTGFMSDPVAGYGALDCLVLPSYSEGFGRVILEAGAMELPVIATKVMGCVDAVVHEQTGFLVEPRQKSELANAMSFLMNNRDIGRSWGKNARRRCISLFSQELVWGQYQHLYEKIIRDG